MSKVFHCQILVAIIRDVLHLIPPNRGLEFQFMIYRMTANSTNSKIGQQALYYAKERSQYPFNRRLGVPQNRSGRFVKARSSWPLLRVESQFLHRRARNLVIPRTLTTPLLQKEALLKIIDKNVV
jgi:hypothetical protein